MYRAVLSGALLGVEAGQVWVEVDVSNGLPTVNMVGSLGQEVRESRERVWAALKNAGMEIPPMRITINLSPADLRKEGTAFDLPIAVALLGALEYYPREACDKILFMGELGLDGEVKPVRGVLPMVRAAVQWGIRECIVPAENAGEGGIIPGITVRGVSKIEDLFLFLRADEEERDKILPKTEIHPEELFAHSDEWRGMDFNEVNGQEVAKRAAEIAAAGFHNLLMVGPPGAGKSMIARRIPGIMPPLTLEESLEVTTVASVAGVLGKHSIITQRPFQSPHHSISQVALTGGGHIPRPGMISLSHRGVLFLDELTEFQRQALESMRQPLEEHQIQIVRTGGDYTYPADFMLVCAMNPCPCGYYPDRNKCRCNESQMKRYMGKISGPILDRIDLCVELQAVDVSSLQKKEAGESSRIIRERVKQARNLQRERFQGTSYRFNADIQAADMERFCSLGTEEQRLMEQLYQSMGLSARTYHRILKVSRTIADLSGCSRIDTSHILEAACYRPAQDFWK